LLQSLLLFASGPRHISIRRQTSKIAAFSRGVEPRAALGIHKRAEIRSDLEKGEIKKRGDRVAAITEGKNYELIDRNESGYRRGDRLRRVDRGRHGPRVEGGNGGPNRYAPSVPIKEK
jgi:hypothetical protein